MQAVGEAEGVGVTEGVGGTEGAGLGVGQEAVQGEALEGRLAEALAACSLAANDPWPLAGLKGSSLKKGISLPMEGQLLMGRLMGLPA